MGIQKESELYEPLKAYFVRQGYEVKSEVRHCDLVAMHTHTEKAGGDLRPVIVEFKKTLNLSVLLQGLKRQKLTPHVYIAIEYKIRKKGAAPGTWSEYTNLCKRLGLGLLTVQFFKRKPPHVELWCKPQVMHATKLPLRTKRLLHEFRERSGDYNVGGSSQTKIVTAYRELSLKCALQLRKSGPTKLNRLTEALESRKIGSLMQKNVYGWFQRVERGVYELSQKGEEALEHYQYITDHFADH